MKSKVRLHNAEFKGALSFIFTFFILFSASTGTSSAELTATANHDHITVDFFYHGSTVGVGGISDAGTDLVIKITAPERHQTLKEKGKVAGLLWMNVGTLNLEHVPPLYFLRSTRNPEEILSKEEMDRYLIGYPALRRHIEMSPLSNEEERTKWFDEFIKLKEHANLYLRTAGDVRLTEQDGKQHYYVLTAWPYQAPPGDYVVTVYAVRDGKVIETAEAKVLVEQVGIVKRLSSMAKDRGAFYGILSIAAALGAGFGVGMIFRKGGGAH